MAQEIELAGRARRKRRIALALGQVQLVCEFGSVYSGYNVQSRLARLPIAGIDGTCAAFIASYIVY